jgi:hypothetical protein
MSPSINRGEPPVALKKAVCAGRTTYQDARVYADARGPKDLYSEDVESMGLFDAVIPKMEVRKMQRRMRTSHRARASQGKPLGGTRPFSSPIPGQTGGRERQGCPARGRRGPYRPRPDLVCTNVTVLPSVGATAGLAALECPALISVPGRDRCGPGGTALSPRTRRPRRHR